jgi:hypothetical protein
MEKKMRDFLSQLVVVTLGSGGLLFWAGKVILEKSIQQKIQQEADKIKLLSQNDLEYRKAQIERLYGPLYGLLKTNRKIYDLWMSHSLVEVNQKVKQLFKENNEKANEIIIKNAHLIDENPMPDHFIKFATSSQVWCMYCADSNDGELPEHLSQHPDIKWCQEFEDYVYSKYESLSKKLGSLYETYSIK